MSPVAGDRQLLTRFTDRTIAHLLPMFLQMLKDDFPDVRLHIISKLEQVNKGMFRNEFFFTMISLSV